MAFLIVKLFKSHPNFFLLLPMPRLCLPYFMVFKVFLILIKQVCFIMSYSYFLELKIIFEFLKAFLIFPRVILLFILIFSPTQPFSFIILIISFFVLPPGDFFPKLLQKKTFITFQSALYLFHYQQTRNHFIQHLLTQEFQVLLLIQLELIHL